MDGSGTTFVRTRNSCTPPSKPVAFISVTTARRLPSIALRAVEPTDAVTGAAETSAVFASLSWAEIGEASRARRSQRAVCAWWREREDVHGPARGVAIFEATLRPTDGPVTLRIA